MLIGQKRLKRLIDNLTNVPRFILLVGQKGQGRKTLAYYIKGKLGRDTSVYFPQDKKVDDIRDIIADSQALTHPRIYLLPDAEEMTVQAQNALLKMAEEPPKNAYIIMTVESEYNVLPTIVSRAKVYRLDPYSIEELQQVTSNELLLKVCTNIGQIKRFMEYDVQGVYDLCAKIVDNIKRISASNVFNIVRHIDLNELDLFMLMLTYVMNERLQNGTLDTNDITILYKWKPILANKGINKTNALEMMFLEMRGV